MRMLCVDDEPLMLKMLEMAIKEAKPDADVTAYRFCKPKNEYYICHRIFRICG